MPQEQQRFSWGIGSTNILVLLTWPSWYHWQFQELKVSFLVLPVQLLQTVLPSAQVWKGAAGKTQLCTFPKQNQGKKHRSCGLITDDQRKQSPSCSESSWVAFLEMEMGSSPGLGKENCEAWLRAEVERQEGKKS